MFHSLPFERINEFILISILQEGPYSYAVLGYQENLNRPAFLKLLKPAAQTDQNWIERFKREARVCAKLKSPHIVDIYTFGNFNDYFYIASEYMQGISLKELLLKEKKLKLELALFILLNLLEALKEVHGKGIIHRDIKPGNILIDISGEVKLTDFGLAYLGEDTTLTQQDTILGTPAYMSPEQITGDPILPQSDFFSLGSTFYEMITGRKAFHGDSYSACIQKILHEDPDAAKSLIADLPPEIDNLIRWLLSKESTERPGETGQITQFLRHLSSRRDPAKEKAILGEMVQKYYQPRGDIDEPVESKIGPETTRAERHRGIFSRWPVYLASALIIFGIIFLVFWLSSKEKTDSGPISSPVFTDSTGIKTESRVLTDTVMAERDSGNLSAENQPVVQSGQPDKLTVTASSGRKIPDSTGDDTEFSIMESEGKEVAAESYRTILELSIEPWGILTMDGVVIDSFVHMKKLTVDTGTHQLILSHPNFPPKVVELNLNPGETRNVRYSFLENSGYLWIDTRPWAEVYIDDKYIDSTPLKRPIILPEGKYTLELRHPAFQKIREEILIAAGDTLSIEKIL